MAIARWQATIQDEAGNICPGASVEVRFESTGALASLYSDREGATGIPNATTADADGFVGFYVEDGTYRITATFGSKTRTWRYVLIGRGDRYDLIFASSGQLGDAEELPFVVVVTPLKLPAGLPGSMARCEVVPTAETIITFEKSTDSGENWTDVFTVTFAIGARTGTFTLAEDASLGIGDLLRPKGPASHDATFAGFSATIAAIR